MAIFESRTKTGISWVGESIAFLKQSPRKWLSLALVYIGLFVLLPSLPGLQIFAFITILAWPVFIAVAMRMYRNVEVHKQEDLKSMMKIIQPKMRSLIALGAVSLLYFVVVSIILSSDIQALAQILQDKEQMNEQELALAVETMVPLFLKLMLLFTPLMIATWFAPMLIAFNNYSLLKALKSSIAGVLQHTVAMTAAWLLLSAGVVTLLLISGILAGIVAVVMPALSQTLMTIIMFGCVLLSTALMLAFQYVSYRDIFRAVL